MSDYNYYGDRRTSASPPPYTFEHNARRGGTVTLSDRLIERLRGTCDEYDEETRSDVDTGPFEHARCEAEVCDLCNGRGKVVNPSIDCDGLTREDFDEDPGFEEEYFGGMYDIACPQCAGQRVVFVWTNMPEHVQEAIDDMKRDDAEARRERMYGY